MNVNRGSTFTESRNNNQNTLRQEFGFFSPFQNQNINQGGINFNDIFDDSFLSFGAFPGNSFNSNFSSNFTSSFHEPMARIIFFQTMNNEPQGNPPATEEVIHLLKKIKMNEKFCKKNEKGDLEYPTCSVCLAETSQGEECLLLPCGHIFHSSCIEKWLKLHDNCPVCRFELTIEKVKKFNEESKHKSQFYPFTNETNSNNNGGGSNKNSNNSSSNNNNANQK